MFSLGAIKVGKYTCGKAPLQFTCACGREHTAAYNNIRRRGACCPPCAQKGRSASQRISKDYVRDLVESKGYKIVNCDYQNVFDKISLKCPSGHLVSVSIRSFKQNEGRCKQCACASIRGENHPRFKHGRSKEDRSDRNKCRVQHNEWKRILLARYEYACVICHKKDGRRLCAHHLNGYNWDVDNRYNPDNGVILCKDHHDSFHRTYGKGNNTKEQFDAFRASVLS